MTQNKVILIIVLIIVLVGAAVLFSQMGLQGGVDVKNPKRIAILVASDLQLTGADGLKAGLKELGYKEGIDMNYEIFNPKGDRDLTKTMAQAIVAKKPDVLVTLSTTAASAVRDANKDAALPVVAADVGNFKELGIEDIQHPGGFMTGVVADNVAPAPKRMEILKTLLPNLKRIAVLLNPKHISYNEILQVHKEGAKRLGVEAVFYEVTKKEDLPKVMEKVARDRPDAFMITSEAIISGNADLIAPILKKAKIPSIDFNVERGVSSGYLIVYGISRFNVGKQSARIIYKVMQGEKPGDIPVEFASVLTFEINAALAKAMGVTIPDSLLLQANKVYNE